MKKKLAVCLLICLIFGVVSMCVLFREFISAPGSDDSFLKEADVVFGVISDTHYADDDSDVQRRINTKKALNYFKSNDVELIYINGDVSDLGGATSYEKLVEDITTVYPDKASRPTIIMTADNHEYYEAWHHTGFVPTTTFEELQNRFCESLAEVRGVDTGTNCQYKINGYHFIGISSDEMSGAHALYSDATTQYLKNALDAAVAEDPEKPIFVGIHQPPKDTVVRSELECSPMLNSILEQYPQAVVFTSHTHCSIIDERSIWQGDYTVVNTGAMYYVNSFYDYEEGHQFAQGLLVAVKDNMVQIQRYDFWNEEIIKDNWIVQTSSDKSTFTYTDERANDRTAPTFAKRARVKASWINDEMVEIRFPAAKHDDYVYEYKVLIYEDGSLLREDIFSSNYFLGLNKMPKTIVRELSGLNSNSDYMFVVKASECYGNESESIAGELQQQ